MFIKYLSTLSLVDGNTYNIENLTEISSFY